MTVDREIVNLRLARIEGHLAEFDEFGRLTRFEFTANYPNYLRAKAAVASTVFALANILRHVDRATGGRAEDPLGAAVEAGWLATDLAARLRNWIALEPIVARAHFDEDRDMIYDLVTTERASLVEFARAITTWMDAQSIE